MIYTIDEMKEQAVVLGEHIVNTHETVRQTGLRYSLSKSTVHSRVTVLLPDINAELFKQVRVVMESNFNDRQRRGGVAVHKKDKVGKT